MREVKGDLCHQMLRQKTTPKLAFNESADFGEWKARVKQKFIELFGIDSIMKNACPLKVEVEAPVQKEGYKQMRFEFDSEYGATVPCYILVPDEKKEKYPVCITLQGHSTGFHNSIAEPKDDGDGEYALTRGCFAVQAVKNGYAAIAIEQRGMGERRPNAPHQKDAKMCEYTAHIALLLGRTILGERIWDVSKTIDVLSDKAITEFAPNLDLNDITIMGNSGGGTMSYYAACFDERITQSAPSCAFCTFEHSIMNWYHCSCNFVPHAYEWFDMQDLACLIAPRKLSILAGEVDPIFLIEGVKKGYETVKKIYEKAGATDKCSLTIMPKGHYWCQDIGWKGITDMHKA